MSTLNRIREFALVAAVAAGVLVTSAAPACEDEAIERANIALFVDLGHMTVLAQRDTNVADLGSLTVTAPRLSDVRIADLGSMTVTAPRIATRVADLGSMTVTATRFETVVVAARGSDRSWN